MPPSERTFWRLVWLCCVRIPFSMFPLRAAIPLAVKGSITWIVARYTGWNLMEGRWTWDARRGDFR